MIPWSEAELQAGLIAGAGGALVIAVLLALRPPERPAGGGRAPWPYGGMVLVGAGLVALRVVGPLPWEVLLGAIGVTAVVDLVAVAGRSGPVRAVAALPFALLVATAEPLPDAGWFQVLVAVAIAGGGALAGATDEEWQQVTAAPVLLAIAAAGTYAAVPDTEHALAFLGVALWFAALAFPWSVASLGPGGAAGAVSLFVWAGAYGARGRPAALVGAVACLGLLAALPVAARLASGMPSLLEDLGPRMRVLALAVVQVAVVLFAARTAGLQSSTGRAVAFALPPVTIAIALATVLQPPGRPRRELGERRQLRPRSDGGDAGRPGLGRRRPEA